MSLNSAEEIENVTKSDAVDGDNVTVDQTKECNNEDMKKEKDDAVISASKRKKRKKKTNKKRKLKKLKNLNVVSWTLEDKQKFITGLFLYGAFHHWKNHPYL